MEALYSHIVHIRFSYICFNKQLTLNNKEANTSSIGLDSKHVLLCVRLAVCCFTTKLRTRSKLPLFGAGLTSRRVHSSEQISTDRKGGIVQLRRISGPAAKNSGFIDDSRLSYPWFPRSVLLIRSSLSQCIKEIQKQEM